MLTLRRLFTFTRLDERGQVLPLVAGGMAAILIMIGLIVDGGNGFQNKQSVHNAADAAAIAAALEIATNTPCLASPADPVAACAGMYAGLNGANGPNGDSSAQTALPPCSAGVSDTVPPSSPPGCYVYPYKGNGAQVEVWLKRATSNFFGKLLGTTTSYETARAVGALTSGNPPPITFAALDPECANHTLLVKLGGNLVVNSGIYANSCSGHDAFDVFNGGSISAPTIQVTGGWETHNSSKVFVPAGVICSFPKNAGGTDWQISAATPGYSPTPPGCPEISQPILQDPFALFPPAPSVGSPRCSAGATSKIAYNPNVTLKTPAVTTSAATAFAKPVTLTAQTGDGTTGSLIPYNPAVTVRRAVGSGSSNYANPVTLKAPAGTASNLSTYNQNVSLAANVVTTASVNSYSPNVTLTQAVAAGGGGSNKVTVTNTGGASAVAVNDVIQVDSEQMLVTAVTAGAGPWTLTVTRAFNGTAAAAHAVNAPVKQVLLPTRIKVTDAGGALAVKAGNTIQVDSEQMSVTNVSGAGPWVLTVTRGFNGTALATHATGTTVYQVVASTILQVTNTGAGSAVAVNDVIQVGNEQMFVTKVQNGAATVYNLTVTRAFDGTTIAAHALGAPVLIPANVVYVTGNGEVHVNDVIQIDNEQMFVISVPTANPETLIVTRAYNATTAAPHSIGAAVSQPVDDTVIQITNAGAQEVTAGMVIQINSEQLLVDSVIAAGAQRWDLNVERGFNGTNEVTHLSGAAVTWFPDQTLQVTNTGATSPVTPGDIIQIDGEQMLVVAVNFIGANTWNLTVQRGYSGTPEATHTANTTVFQITYLGAASAPAPCMLRTGTQTIFPGAYYGGICIGAASGSPDCAGANCKATGGSTTTIQPYPGGVTVSMDQTGDDTQPGYTTLVVNNSAPISVGDLISIDDEEESVTAKSGDGHTLTVTREANGTEDAAHTTGTPVSGVVTTPNGTPYNPVEKLNANITTVSATSFAVKASAAPGTNGIKVGDVIQVGSEAMLVGTPAPTYNAQNVATVNVTRGYDNTTATTHTSGDQVYRVAAAGAPTPPIITLSKGVYIMAGGGFNVCGAGSVRAPQGAMIYNTNDSVSSNGYGALGQVDINTSGNVHLGPMTSGIYGGMTIFQDRSLTLNAGDCNGKTGNPSLWDIALQSAAPLPVSGELGSISGTIYAPHLRADFGDSMSGTANLAVVTSCIYINGANSTFNFHPDHHQLFGVSATLGG